MLNSISAQYICKNTKNIQKSDYMDGFCLQGELDLTLFVCKGITKMSLVLSWVPSTQFLFTSLFISLLTSISTSLSVIFYFFSIISSAIIGFLCTAFLGICLSACFSNIVDFQNRITDFAHNIHKIITCKKTMNISSQLHYHD